MTLQRSCTPCRTQYPAGGFSLHRGGGVVVWNAPESLRTGLVEDRTMAV
jgi:hypothetical protein